MPLDEESSEDVFAIWDINVRAFEAFLALETQWRVVVLTSLEGTRPIRTGLDYAAVEIVMRIRDLPAETFEFIREMEAAALLAYAEVARS